MKFIDFEVDPSTLGSINAKHLKEMGIPQNDASRILAAIGVRTLAQ